MQDPKRVDRIRNSRNRTCCMMKVNRLRDLWKWTSFWLVLNFKFWFLKPVFLMFAVECSTGIIPLIIFKNLEILTTINGSSSCYIFLILFPGSGFRLKFINIVFDTNLYEIFKVVYYQLYQSRCIWYNKLMLSICLILEIVLFFRIFSQIPFT